MQIIISLLAELQRAKAEIRSLRADNERLMKDIQQQSSFIRWLQERRKHGNNENR